MTQASKGYLELAVVAVAFVLVAAAVLYFVDTTPGRTQGGTMEVSAPAASAPLSDSAERTAWKHRSENPLSGDRADGGHQ